MFPPSAFTVFAELFDMAGAYSLFSISIIAATSSCYTSLSNLKFCALKCLTPLILATCCKFSFASTNLSLE
jgi:hypothetical protein